MNTRMSSITITRVPATLFSAQVNIEELGLVYAATVEAEAALYWATFAYIVAYDRARTYRPWCDDRSYL